MPKIENDIKLEGEGVMEQRAEGEQSERELGGGGGIAMGDWRRAIEKKGCVQRLK